MKIFVENLIFALWQVLNKSRLSLTSAGFVPSISPFPTEEETRERMFVYLPIRFLSIVLVKPTMN